MPFLLPQYNMTIMDLLTLKTIILGHRIKLDLFSQIQQ